MKQRIEAPFLTEIEPKEVSNLRTMHQRRACSGDVKEKLSHVWKAVFLYMEILDFQQLGQEPFLACL